MKAIKVAVAAAATLATVQGSAVAQDWPGQGTWSGPMLGFGYPTPEMTEMMGYGHARPRLSRSSGTSQATSYDICDATPGHVDDRLVKTELKITLAQESLWTTYVAAARDSANATLTRCTTLKSLRGNASIALPDRLDQRTRS